LSSFALPAGLEAEMTDYSPYLAGNIHINEKLQGQPAPKSIPLEFVAWAYRLFLDREPEDMKIAEEIARGVTNSRQLRQAFLASEEYAIKSGHTQATVKRDAKREPLSVETIEDHAALVAFFDHVKKTWTALGETEPHWSVLSADQFKQASLQDNLEQFNQSGRAEVERLFSMLSSYGIALPAASTCIEYGCGVGRVSRWLAERFGTVIACDISNSHMELARKFVADNAVNNVAFRIIQGIGDIESLPPAEFFYSVIVLQHNPPPSSSSS
jgi:2-polyprenyl-3-methyl-5-hydroxy-6-metoxy-1,4-benzoquinol methylase